MRALTIDGGVGQAVRNGRRAVERDPEGFAVVAVAGALMLALDVRMINRYD